MWQKCCTLYLIMEIKCGRKEKKKKKKKGSQWVSQLQSLMQSLNYQQWEFKGGNVLSPLTGLHVDMIKFCYLLVDPISVNVPDHEKGIFTVRSHLHVIILTQTSLLHSSYYPTWAVVNHVIIDIPNVTGLCQKQKRIICQNYILHVFHYSACLPFPTACPFLWQGFRRNVLWGLKLAHIKTGG